VIPFHYNDGQLYCEKADVSAIAETVGTPAYLYSETGILENYKSIDAAFRGHRHVVCHALKANSNPEILKLLAEAGAGADVVSGGEMLMALKAGFPAKKIVFAGVGKTDAEIRLALEKKILALNVESRQELEVVADIAAEMGTKAPIAIRINPDIDIEGHPYLTTGKSANKFGISLQEARDCYLWAAGQKSLHMMGVHCHIGSMIKKAEPYRKMAETLAAFVKEMQAEGLPLEHIDLGGGIGVDYSKTLAEHGSPFFLDPNELAAEIMPILQSTGCEIYLEPGRSIVGSNGLLLIRVLYRKETGGKKFLVVDGAMNDLIRPSLYGAFHDIRPLRRTEAAG